MRCWLLGVFVSWGGRKGRQEREERRSEEGRSGKKQGRKARKEGNIAPRMEPLGVENAPQKAPKRSPKGSQIYAWRPLGGRWRPWGPLGGPRLIFERFWMILGQIRAQKELWRLIFKHFRPRKGSKKVPKQLKIIENHAFLAFWRPLGDPQTSCLAAFPK